MKTTYYKHTCQASLRYLKPILYKTKNKIPENRIFCINVKLLSLRVSHIAIFRWKSMKPRWCLYLITLITLNFFWPLRFACCWVMALQSWWCVTKRAMLKQATCHHMNFKRSYLGNHLWQNHKLNTNVRRKDCKFLFLKLNV